MNSDRLRDKFRGALIGTFVGDALGAPVEGLDEERLSHALHMIASMEKDSQERIEQEIAFGLITGSDRIPDNTATYTDDTQMTIGVAESLIAYGRFDGADMAKRFADNFEGHRGYGAGAYGLMLELQRGEPWDEVGGRLFGGQGSFGNGAAMRIAPVGVFGHRDPFVLRHLAERQAAITHTHPLGIAGAVMQAAAVAVACRYEPGDDFEPTVFLDEVEQWSPALPEAYAYGIADIRSFLEVPAPSWEVSERLGSGIEAHDSVPAALYSFLRLPHSFESAVTFAVRLGDDTDTVGAMCGAIAGAYHGASRIPNKLLRALENGPKGRDYVFQLADDLFDKWQERHA